MYIISDNDLRKSVYSALSSQTREFRQRLSFGEGIGSRFNKQISFDAGIKKIEISQVGNADNNGLVLGNCCSSSATVEFYNPRNTYRYNDKTMFVECGIKLDDGEYFYIPCGYYKVEKPETDDDWKTVKITAYDVVDEMSGKWNTALTMPTTSYLLIKEIADKYNLELEIDPIILSDLQKRQITETEASMLTAYKEREVVGFLVGCLGGNARVNTVGKLYVGIYNPFPQEVINIETKVQWQNGFKKTLETEFEIASITSGVGDNVFTAGTGKGITFVNPLITEEEIAEIYENYGGFTFQPSACEWRGNPCVECGDVVFVFDKSGNYYTVFVARQDIDLTGGLSMTTHCPSGDSDVSFDTLNDEIRQALNKQYTDLQQAIIDATNKINGALGGYYEVLDSDNDGNPDGWLIKEYEDGHGGLIRANKAGIGLSEDGGKTYRTAITYKGINADEITSGKVKAEFIETDKLVVGTGNVEGLDGELAELLKAAEDAESKANIAQNTANTANSTANTASTNASSALSVANSANGKIANWASANDTTLIDGAKIYTGSITAKQIASESITADKLSVGTGVELNQFYNDEFYDGTRGWYGYNGSLTAQGTNQSWAYMQFKPSNSGISAIMQKVWLVNGQRYSIMAQIYPLNWSQNASTYYIRPFYGIAPGLVGDDLRTAYNYNGETVVKMVFDYDGDTGFVDLGIAFSGIMASSTTPSTINIAWISFSDATNETVGFYCSRKEWLASGYKDSNFLAGSVGGSTTADTYLAKKALTIDVNGNLVTLGTIKSNNGEIGSLVYSRERMDIVSHSYYKILDVPAFGASRISFINPLEYYEFTTSDTPEKNNAEYSKKFSARIEVASSSEISGISGNEYTMITSSGVSVSDSSGHSSISATGIDIDGVSLTKAELTALKKLI